MAITGREMSKLLGYLLLITGFLACPCHLPLTLPLLLGLLSGTAAGAVLPQDLRLVVGFSFVYFVLATALGLLWISRSGRQKAERSASSASPVRAPVLLKRSSPVASCCPPAHWVPRKGSSRGGAPGGG
jgi:hypothetical protein